MKRIVLALIAVVPFVAHSEDSEIGRFVIKKIEWEAGILTEKGTVSSQTRSALARIDTKTGKVDVLKDFTYFENGKLVANIEFSPLENSTTVGKNK
jgi:hypothetical protein